MSALNADEPDTDKVVKWLEHNLGVHLLGWQVAALQRYRANQPIAPDLSGLVSADRSAAGDGGWSTTVVHGAPVPTVCLCLLFDPSDNDEEVCACGHPVHDHANDVGQCRA